MTSPIEVASQSVCLRFTRATRRMDWKKASTPKNPTAKDPTRTQLSKASINSSAIVIRDQQLLVLELIRRPRTYRLGRAHCTSFPVVGEDFKTCSDTPPQYVTAVSNITPPEKNSQGVLTRPPLWDVLSGLSIFIQCRLCVCRRWRVALLSAGGIRMQTLEEHAVNSEVNPEVVHSEVDPEAASPAKSTWRPRRGRRSLTKFAPRFVN